MTAFGCLKIGQRSLLKGHTQPCRSDQLCFRPGPISAPARWQAARRILTCAKARGKQKVANQAPAVITAPLKVQVKEQLTPVEKLSMAPFWSTFCGTSNGAWQGVQAAFSPVTGPPKPAIAREARKAAVGAEMVTVQKEHVGDAEPVALGPDGKPVLDVRTSTLETRVVEGDEDKVLRRTMQAASAHALQAQAASAAKVEEAKAEAEDDTAWDEETIASDEEGLVIFDGGTYSRGPTALVELGGAASAGDDEDLEADKERLERQLTLEPSTSGSAASDDVDEGVLPSEPDVGRDLDALNRRTWLIEQCLAWGGEQRLRLRLTLAVAPGEEEFEVDVLRIAMHRESWQCLAEDESPTCVADTSQILPELSKAPRPAAAKMAGPWKVFDVTAVPVPDETAVGDDPKTLLMYFSSETQQDWRPGKREPDEAGGAFWLPENVLLELHMVPPMSRGEAGDAQEGMELQEQGRGLCISFSWLINDKTLIGLQREYDTEGALLEVRSRTAILGNWAGGRM